MLKSGLQTRIPALLDASWYQAEFSDSLHQKVLGFLPSPEVELQKLQFLSLNLRSSALNIGQEPLTEEWATSFSLLSAQVRHRGEALHSLATCDAPPHLQQAPFLPGSVQSRETWPYPSHLKHRETSTCSRMRQFTHPTLSLPRPSKLRASASVKRTTAVGTPLKRLYSLHCSSRSGLPSAMHSAATTSSLVTVSSRSLTSSDLFETKDLTSALCPID